MLVWLSALGSLWCGLCMFDVIFFVRWALSIMLCLGTSVMSGWVGVGLWCGVARFGRSMLVGW